MRLRGALAALVLMVSPAAAQEPVRLYAAGSLRSVLEEVAKQFADESGIKVAGTYGASGLLRDRIDRGEKAELFASANMEHPQMLAKAGKAGPVVLFARNQLCALAKPSLDVEPLTVLETMLDPAIKLGTSTPRADPSGDYAWELFEKADKLRPGAYAALSAKALKLSGGPDSPPPPKGRNVYGYLLEKGDADLYLAYCTAALEAKAEVPSLQIVQIPEALAVGADYGLVVVMGARPDAQKLADYILSPAGQSLLSKYGFSPR